MLSHKQITARTRISCAHFGVHSEVGPQKSFAQPSVKKGWLKMQTDTTWLRGSKSPSLKARPWRRHAWTVPPSVGKNRLFLSLLAGSLIFTIATETHAATKPSSSTSANQTCATLKARWQTAYVNDFSINLNSANFRCEYYGDEIVLREGVLALTLRDLEKLPLAKQSLTPSSGKAKNFYDLLKDKIVMIQVSDRCPPFMLASTLDRTVTLCRPFFSNSREDRASTLIHEARHTDSDDQGHFPCEGGKYRSEPQSCDPHFYAGQWKGSGYNADVYFYSWALKNSAKTELKRSVMQGMINALVPDRFNNITAKEIKKWRADQ